LSFLDIYFLINMFHPVTSLVLFSILLPLTSAICPGYNFGIGQSYSDAGLPSCKFPLQPISPPSQQSPISSDTPHAGKVYTSDCKVAEVRTIYKDDNVCDTAISGIACSPAPIVFTQLHARNDLIYDCREDVNAGDCGGDKIGVCVSVVRKDGE
jgi:hypothetical protein